jgi:hypothetical protein
MSIATSPVRIGTRPTPISFTETATAKLTGLLAEEAGSDSLALRVAVRPVAARATATTCSSTPRSPPMTTSGNLAP